MQAYMLKNNEGEAIWFLNTLVTYKATKETTFGQFGLIEQLLPPGFEPPLHIHHHEDEAFYVLEGRITFFCADTTFEAETGSFVFLPRGLAHSFKVNDAKSARLLQLNAPAGFEQFHVDMGEPAKTRTLPEPSAPDIAKLQRLAAQYGFDLVPISSQP